MQRVRGARAAADAPPLPLWTLYGVTGYAYSYTATVAPPPPPPPRRVQWWRAPPPRYDCA